MWPQNKKQEIFRGQKQKRMRSVKEGSEMKRQGDVPKAGGWDEGAGSCAAGGFAPQCVFAPIFVTVALLFTWLVANCGQHLTSQMSRRVLSAAEMLNYTLTGTLSLVELVLAIAAVAYAWSYCHDRSSGFFLQAVERWGCQPMVRPGRLP